MPPAKNGVTPHCPERHIKISRNGEKEKSTKRYPNALPLRSKIQFVGKEKIELYLSALIFFFLRETIGLCVWFSLKRRRRGSRQWRVAARVEEEEELGVRSTVLSHNLAGVYWRHKQDFFSPLPPLLCPIRSKWLPQPPPNSRAHTIFCQKVFVKYICEKISFSIVWNARNFQTILYNI